MTVIDDAIAAFEEQARELVREVADLPEMERIAAIEAEIERYSEHRYLFTNERALDVLRSAKARSV
jgi:cell fate (sporulation/competence/biofilm development) regulator YlbF (YheA/YmcA/DUF963 family)